MQFDPLAGPAGPATPLSFSLRLIDGRIIASLADATTLLAGLTEQQRASGHWRIAARMLDIATKEPSYLKAATMSLQSALLLQGLLDDLTSPEATGEASP